MDMYSCTPVVKRSNSAGSDIGRQPVHRSSDKQNLVSQGGSYLTQQRMEHLNGSGIRSDNVEKKLH